MWPEWLRSPSRGHGSPETPPPPLPSPRYFSCSSFKDVQTLLSDDPPIKNGSLAQQPLHPPKKPSVFHRVRIATSLLRNHRLQSNSTNSTKLTVLSPPPNSDDRQIVVYLTTLRIVRKTFEDCRTVRSILRGLRISIDERDLSMDSKYLDELEAITGSKKVITLPIVFIGGKFVGGADEIKEMNENGDLKKIIRELTFQDDNNNNNNNINNCDLCGGLRFILCEQCNGSHKIYSDKYGFRSCTSCNINGLIRCPLCNTVHRRRMSS